jgi:hypothetical protein
VEEAASAVANLCKTLITEEKELAGTKNRHKLELTKVMKIVRVFIKTFSILIQMILLIIT